MDVDITCPECGREYSVTVGIGEPDRSVGYNSYYVDYVESAEMPNMKCACGHAFDTDKIGETGLEDAVSRMNEREYEPDFERGER